jgi:hypothetical protein
MRINNDGAHWLEPLRLSFAPEPNVSSGPPKCVCEPQRLNDAFGGSSIGLSVQRWRDLVDLFLVPKLLLLYSDPKCSSNRPAAFHQPERNVARASLAPCRWNGPTMPHRFGMTRDTARAESGTLVERLARGVVSNSDVANANLHNLRQRPLSQIEQRQSLWSGFPLALAVLVLWRLFCASRLVRTGCFLDLIKSLTGECRKRLCHQLDSVPIYIYTSVQPDNTSQKCVNTRLRMKSLRVFEDVFEGFVPPAAIRSRKISLLRYRRRCKAIK